MFHSHFVLLRRLKVFANTEELASQKHTFSSAAAYTLKHKTAVSNYPWLVQEQGHAAFCAQRLSFPSVI